MDVIIKAIPQCETSIFLDVLKRLQACKDIGDIKEIKPYINGYFDCGFNNKGCFYVNDKRDIQFILIKL